MPTADNASYVKFLPKLEAAYKDVVDELGCGCCMSMDDFKRALDGLIDAALDAGRSDYADNHFCNPDDA